MFLLLTACALLGAASGCAPAATSSQEASAPQPVEKQGLGVIEEPRLHVIWREKATEIGEWAYLPQEYASPVFLPRYDDLLVASSGGYLTRLRAGSGEIVWRQALHEDESYSGKHLVIHADPVVVEDTIYIAALTGQVQARSLKDGSLLWSYTADNSVESVLVVEDDRLFFMDAGETLSALDATTGKLLWRYKRRSPEYFTIKGSGIPVIDGDAVYCGFSDGTLAALQIDTGEAIWTADLSNEKTEFTDVDTRPIVSGEVIYTSSYAGGVFAVSRLDGTVQWQIPIEGVTRMLKRGKDLLLSSATGRVINLDLTRRQANWSFRFKQDIPVEMADFGPYLFVSTTSGPLSIFDRQSGALLTNWNPSTGFNVPVVFEQRRGFLLSNAGYIYSFEVGY